MRAALAGVLLFAGCTFTLEGASLEAGVQPDGAAPLDANLEMPVTDFAVAVDAAPFDLTGRVPDGAMPRQVGYLCVAAADCDNGQCIDGYCCADLCDPTDPAFQCMACNVPGAEGHCVPALDGTDPRGLCDAQPVSGCGQDGLCDGRGNCRLYAVGTSCGASVCTNGSVVGPPVCDGNGQCVLSMTTASCDPYTCNTAGDGCASSCTQTSGCVAGATCSIDGTCNNKRGLGQACTSGSQCQSTFCAQGVCCNRDCTGGCRSCALPGGTGLCLFVAAGTDPAGDCTAETRDSCGLDGQCDGAGQCRRWSAGTPCASATCSGDSTVSARVCDGRGMCLPGIPTSCDPYMCNPATGSCYGQPCTSSAQCAAGAMCRRNGRCG
jgi:hypothetical protein